MRTDQKYNLTERGKELAFRARTLPHALGYNSSLGNVATEEADILGCVFLDRSFDNNPITVKTIWSRVKYSETKMTPNHLMSTWKHKGWIKEERT